MDKKTVEQIRDLSKQIKEELVIAAKYIPVKKDILIVLHNQLECTKNCIQSIRKHTKDYQIYIWDNGSDQETAKWLKQQKDLIVHNHPFNLGFIKPNNRLAEMSSSPYIILLNSDTIVMPNWDKALIAHLQNGYAQVGYSGGILDEKFIGYKTDCGEDNIDYIEGWCFAISRELYSKLGLFDEQHLDFAYCEDADFSLRIKEAEYKIRALSLKLVRHIGNQTINEVAKKTDCVKSFVQNHLYMQKRWNHCDWLLCNRVT